MKPPRPQHALVLLCLLLPGCAAMLPAAGASGILFGVAAVTNADVNAAEAYLAWRRGSSAAP